MTENAVATHPIRLLLRLGDIDLSLHSVAASTNMFTLTASAVHARTHAVPSASTSSPRGAPTRVAHVAPSKSFASKGRPTRSSHVAKMGMDTGNPFVDGWLDLTDTVSGGGKDLGVSELAEKLGKDVYMDINGWCVSLCPHASQSPISLLDFTVASLFPHTTALTFPSPN